MNRNKLFLILLFLVIGFRKKNNPILFEKFLALRCESNIKEKNIMIMFLIIKMVIYISMTRLKTNLNRKVRDLNKVFLLRIQVRFSHYS